MNKSKLAKLGPGFYVDAQRQLYFHAREFLEAHNLPDTPEVCEEVWAEVRRDFGQIGITQLSGPGEST